MDRDAEVNVYMCVHTLIRTLKTTSTRNQTVTASPLDRG